MIANNGGTKLANYALDLAANNTYNLSSIFSFGYGTIRLFVGGTNASFSGHIDSNGTIQEFGYTNDIGLAQGANKFNLYHNGTDFIIQNNTAAFRSAILVALHL